MNLVGLYRLVLDTTHRTRYGRTSRYNAREGGSKRALALRGTLICSIPGASRRTHRRRNFVWSAAPAWSGRVLSLQAITELPEEALHRGLPTCKRLYATVGQREQAHAELSMAIDLYRAMDMTFWLPQAEAALLQVSGAGVAGQA